LKKSGLALIVAAVLSVIPAQARYLEEVLVRGEITGVDGKFVIIALKRRLIMVPRNALLKRYPARVGEHVVARLPASQIRVTGSKRKKR